MTNPQESKLKRNGVIIKIFNRYSNEVASIPAMVRHISRFTEIYNKIEETHPHQAADRKGITIGKNMVRDDVTYLGLTVSGALHSYAVEKGNSDLANRMNLTFTSFNRLTLANFKELCLEVVTEAHKYIDNMTDYGIDSSFVEQFASSAANFKEAANEPRNAVVKISAATQSLANLFAEADDIITKHFDKLMVQFQSKNPDFYREYIASKIIEDRGSRRTKTDSPANARTPVQ